MMVMNFLVQNLGVLLDQLNNYHLSLMLNEEQNK
jgi:hypothetical protein